MGGENLKRRSELPIRIRPMTQGDEPLVLSSWKKSYADAVDWARTEAGRAHYYTHVNGVLPRLLDGSRTAIACNPLDAEHVFGWACVDRDESEGAVLHYAYVKRDYRGMGVARRLLESLGIREGARVIVTHWTDACEDQTWLELRYRPSRRRTEAA